MRSERVNIRELIGATIAHGNLTQSIASEESGADRIGALALADPLGAVLWRVLGQMRTSDIIEARDRLSEKLRRHGIRPEVLQRLSLQVLTEWLGCPCPTCGGRTHALTPDGVAVDCWDCHGSGRGGQSHEQRMRVLRVKRAEYAQLLPVFQEAALILTRADRAVGSQVAAQLERGGRQTQRSVVA